MPRNEIFAGRSSRRDMMVVGATCAAMAFLCLGPAFAHGLPSPKDPEMRIELAVSELAAARDRAAQAGISTQISLAAQSVYDRFLLWPGAAKRTVVTACFWNGSPDLQKKVIASDNAWEGFANITVDYTDKAGGVRVCQDDKSADIRISLDGADKSLQYEADQDPDGSWSFVGASSNFSPRDKPGKRYQITVNLPTIAVYDRIGDEVDFNNYVRHELGHARGLLHEHQRTECKGWFNIEAIMADTKWTREQAEQAVGTFDELAKSGNLAFRPAYAGDYDILSIMQYNFEPRWYQEKNGQINPCERTEKVSDPSPGDKATLIAMYGASANNISGAIAQAGSLSDSIHSFRTAASLEFTSIQLFSKSSIASAKMVLDRAGVEDGQGQEGQKVQKAPVTIPTNEGANEANDALLELQAAVDNLAKIAGISQ